jgi:hypothetical protein
MRRKRALQLLWLKFLIIYLFIAPISSIIRSSCAFSGNSNGAQTNLSSGKLSVWVSDFITMVKKSACRVIFKGGSPVALFLAPSSAEAFDLVVGEAMATV